MRTFVPKVPLSDLPPVPVKADWLDDLNGLQVTFDKDLRSADYAENNWRLRVAGRRRRLLNAFLFGTRVIRSQTQPFGLPVIGNSVDYLATPPDVVGTNGLPVEAFLAYPVNQI